jgi:type IV fimbrial biogenesis protein FimT
MAMKQTGVTLTELIVVLAISAILLGLAIPGFTSLIHSSRLSAATSDLLVSLHLARSEAIKRNARTVACISADGSTCAAGGGWHQGWLIFHDLNNNAALDPGEAVIHARQALPDSIRLTGNSTVSKYISYAPSGGTKSVTGAFQAGTLTVCNVADASGAARRVVISSTGRPRVARVTLASCP